MTSTTYADWTGTAPISIANAPSVADYPVRLALTWIDDDNGTMNADFSDIRFTDTDDNALSYWIESYTASTSAVVWVKVASGTTEIELVYGNAPATSESDGSDVFPFFDDFPGSSLDTSTKWTVASSASNAVSGGILTLAGANDNDDVVYTKSTWGTEYAVRFRQKFGETGGSSFAGWHGTTGTSDVNCAVAYNTNGYRLTTYVSAYERDSQNPDTSYHVYDIARNGATSVIFKRDSTTATFTATSQIPTGSIPFCARQYVSGGAISLDWVCVRAFQATEPTCTVGTTQPNASSVAYDDTVVATRYIDGSITETGGRVADEDTVVATRYVDGSITETKTSTGAATPIGYSFIVDGEDYTTAKVINLQIRDRLNQLPRFDFRAHSLNATDLTHFKAGATVEVYYNGIKRCEGFIERFDEQQSSWFYDCTGYGVGQFLDHRRSDVPTLYPVGVQGENTVKDIITYIVNTSCGFPTTGETGWTIQGESGPDLLIFKIQNQKAMEHVAQLVQLADMDWFASFGAEGRVLTLGDASCVTHTATNLKLGRDIIMSEEVTDLSKVANNIVIQSKDYFGNTILSSIGDYTNVCTVASSETLLKYDAESGTTLLYVFDHSDFPSSGSLFVSTESVTYVGKSDPASTLHPHFYGLTTTASHVAYEPVLFRDSFYITGATAPFLDASPGTIRVGREDISYASVYSVDATTACVSGTLTRGSNYYAHGREAPVFDTTYTLASPTTGTSVATYGRKDEVISGIGHQDMNSLDLAAYGVLRRKCGWPTWGQGMIVGNDFPTTFSTTPRVGDWFYLEEETTTATTLQRITGLDYDMMRGQITINWGASEEYAVSDLKKSDIAMNQAMS